MNYYNEIKETLIKNEIYKKAKDYSKNKSDLNSYYEVGRLLVEAQGGEKRAKYGNKLIKEYSEKLTKGLGKGYQVSNLKRMRQFYIMIQKGAPLAHQLTWSHYIEILPLKDLEKIKYYINITQSMILSRMELRERIKSKEYERIGYKEELEAPKVNTLIKDPLLIKVNKIPKKITEYALHNFILEDMKNFRKELGLGFVFVDDEVKIKIGNNYHYIDFLFYNIKFKCYIVIELKATKAKPEHIGQIKKYINYVDKHIKQSDDYKTVGIILCSNGNKIVMDYCTDESIFIRTYKMKKTKINNGTLH